MDKNRAEWSKGYQSLVDRNIGLITVEQQERLRKTTVCVCGVGGIGSPAFEVLVRTGIGQFKIIDKDHFDPTNMNRQIYAFSDTVGRMKVDVAKEFAEKINPEVVVECYTLVEESNIDAILDGVDIVVLAIDELKPCLVISRKAREMNIPLVEGWAIPYGNVRVFTSETPDLEEAYGLPTRGRSLSDISHEELQKYGLEVLLSLGKIEGVADFYTEEVIGKISEGHITSFAPLAWLTSVMMALETVKVVLNWGNIALGPKFTLYDQFMHKIPKISDL